MKAQIKVLNVLTGVIITIAFLMLWGCSNKEDYEQWCAVMMEKPNGDWVDPEFEQFAQRCLGEE